MNLYVCVCVYFENMLSKYKLEILLFSVNCLGIHTVLDIRQNSQTNVDSDKIKYFILLDILNILYISIFNYLEFQKLVLRCAFHKTRFF